MDPLRIIERFYDPAGKAYAVLVSHGEQVAAKALAVAAAVPHLAADLELVRRGALLHDIGMIETRAPQLGCHGGQPYIRHGVIGRRILEDLGLFAEALICERHVGAGISAVEVRRHGLPLPERDMLPVSVEEQIVCYADKFFSKDGAGPGREKPFAEIIAGLARHGPEQVARFRAWMAVFEAGARARRGGGRPHG